MILKNKKYPKMHWRRRALIDLGWNKKEKLNIFLRFEFYKWYSHQLKNKLIPLNKDDRILFFKTNLKNFIKEDAGTANRIFKTALMDKMTEDNLQNNLTVTKIENDFYSYITNRQSTSCIQMSNNDIDTILNHFDLHKIRCPSNIIKTLTEYELKFGVIKNKNEFLNYRIYYNYFIFISLSLLNKERKKYKKIHLIRTEITSQKLQTKNLLCVGEHNILAANDFAQIINGNLTVPKDLDLNFLELDLIGGDTLYMLIRDYDSKYDNIYKDILKIIINSWNDYILQTNYEQILTPGTNDFLDYITNFVEVWHNSKFLQKLYSKQEVNKYLKFRNFEKQYL